MRATQGHNVRYPVLQVFCSTAARLNMLRMMLLAL